MWWISCVIPLLLPIRIEEKKVTLEERSGGSIAGSIDEWGLKKDIFYFHYSPAVKVHAHSFCEVLPFFCFIYFLMMFLYPALMSHL